MVYLPGIYRDFMQQFPEVSKAYDALAEACHQWGPLDERSRRLVKLGISIGLNSEGGVKSHARQSLEEGISPDELRHAVLMAFTTAGFPAMNLSMKWVEEVIKNAG